MGPQGIEEDPTSEATEQTLDGAPAAEGSKPEGSATEETDGADKPDAVEETAEAEKADEAGQAEEHLLQGEGQGEVVVVVEEPIVAEEAIVVEINIEDYLGLNGPSAFSSGPAGPAGVLFEPRWLPESHSKGC